METENKNNNEKSWKDLILEYGQNFVKNFSMEVVNNIKDKVSQFITQLKGNIIVMLFFLVGFVFLMIGLAMVVDYYVKIPGSGYLILGFLILVLGMLVKIHYDGKK